MPHDLTRADRVRALGRQLDPQTRDASEALWGDASVRPPVQPGSVERDLRYGSHDRHRLDVYGGREGGARPVLLHAHGGGFTGGDKHLAGSYLFDNIGHWAASQGMLGVMMTYRLAPDHTWPAAAEDVSAAVQWVIENAARFGGDPRRIVVAGHSAGAAHVGDYLAIERLNKPQRASVRGAVLISGVYDLSLAQRMTPLRSYYGATEQEQAGRSSIEALADAHCPLFVVAAEADPYDLQVQALSLAGRRGERHQCVPAFTLARGHSHYSIVFHIGSSDTEFTDQVAGFVSDVTAG